MKFHSRFPLALAALCLSSAGFCDYASFSFPDRSHYVLQLPSEIEVGQVMEILEEVSQVPVEDMVIYEGDKALYPEEVIRTYPGEDFRVHVATEDSSVAKGTYAGYRNYATPVSSAEKEDIRYILQSLAQKSWTSLWKDQSKLEKAGNRIDHVHPLRFLECVFTDDELKVYTHNIRKRGGKIWKEFMKGFKDSFHDESKIGNMRDDYIVDFSRNVGIELAKISGIIQAQKWEDFVKTLIIHIPRDGDSGRYDQ